MERAQGAWWFDARDTEAVRDLCRSIYGTTGDDNPVLCDIQFVLENCGSDQVFDYGRQIARRQSRDAAVRLGDGVVIVDGGFPSSGGSAKHPEIRGKATLEIRDVPECLVDDRCTVVRRREPAPAKVEPTADEVLAGIAKLQQALVTAVAAAVQKGVEVPAHVAFGLANFQAKRPLEALPDAMFDAVYEAAVAERIARVMAWDYSTGDLSPWDYDGGPADVRAFVLDTGWAKPAQSDPREFLAAFSVWFQAVSRIAVPVA